MSEPLREHSEQVSALVDGQVRGEEFARTLAYLASTPQAQASWDTYHLIGEAMRSPGVGARAHNPAFVARLQAKLVQEDIKNVAVSALPIRAEAQKSLKTSAANEPWFKRVVGLASVALVALLAWQGVLLLAPASQNANGAGQLAQAPAPLTPTTRTPAAPALLAADSAPALMIRDPELDAMLAAHRQIGGATALQMPSGFLRNATFSENKR